MSERSRTFAQNRIKTPRVSWPPRRTRRKLPSPVSQYPVIFVEEEEAEDETGTVQNRLSTKEMFRSRQNDAIRQRQKRVKFTMK